MTDCFNADCQSNLESLFLYIRSCSILPHCPSFSRNFYAVSEAGGMRDWSVYGLAWCTRSCMGPMEITANVAHGDFNLLGSIALRSLSREPRQTANEKTSREHRPRDTKTSPASDGAIKVWGLLAAPQQYGQRWLVNAESQACVWSLPRSTSVSPNPVSHLNQRTNQ